MMIVELGWALATGLAGSLHCFGMCGPLAIAYSLHIKDGAPGGLEVATHGSHPGTLIYHHLAFHGGRIAAYALTGCLAAGFIRIAGSVEPFHAIRNVLSLLGGGLMVTFGLILLKVISFPSKTGVRASRGHRNNPIGAVPGIESGSLFTRTLARLLRSRSTASKWALGFSAGFLPCMLSWAMVTKAAATGNMVAGASLMVFFGLGTAPALLCTGFFASFFTLRMRLTGERAAALSVIAMGLILAWKGVSRLV
jgi:sulfite exporter TauE/SafE